jgi:hypothetical protein
MGRTSSVAETPTRSEREHHHPEPPAEPPRHHRPEPEPETPEKSEPPSVQPLAAATAATTVASTLATHFNGPVASGAGALAGFALLAKRFDYDVTKGPIPANVQVNLPANCLLLDVRRVVVSALDNTVNLTIGTTLGGTDLLTTQAISTVANSAPVQVLPVTPAPTKLFLNFANATSAPTTGKFSVLLTYART